MRSSRGTREQRCKGEVEMLKVLSVFGTRPEAIKLAPVIRALQKHSDWVVCRGAEVRGRRGEDSGPDP